MTYRLWVNEERTVMVHLWENGTVEVATREETWLTWGPPVTLNEEKVETDVEAAKRRLLSMPPQGDPVPQGYVGEKP